MPEATLTLSGLRRAAHARGESIGARPSGRAHLCAGRDRVTTTGTPRVPRGTRPVCGTRTRQLRPVVGRPRPCRRCVALLARAGALPTVPATRGEHKAAWADLTPVDLWLSRLMAETPDERDACTWLAGLVFDQLTPTAVADPSGQLWTLAEFRTAAGWARQDLDHVGARELTDAEDTADLDDLLADADAREEAAKRRRHRAWQLARV